MRGFTLIEILLVLILVTLIIGFSSYWYTKLSQSSFLLDETASMVVRYLNLARQKAFLGEENNDWGVLFVNSSTAPDSLHLFKGTSLELKESQNLPPQINFVDPPPHSSKTVIFRKLSGETNLTSIQIQLVNSSLTRLICIPPFGSIYVSSSCP